MTKKIKKLLTSLRETCMLKRNETKRNETKRNETKRNETKRNETKRNETKRTYVALLCTKGGTTLSHTSFSIPLLEMGVMI